MSNRTSKIDLFRILGIGKRDSNQTEYVGHAASCGVRSPFKVSKGSAAGHAPGVHSHYAYALCRVGPSGVCTRWRGDRWKSRRSRGAPGPKKDISGTASTAHLRELGDVENAPKTPDPNPWRLAPDRRSRLGQARRVCDPWTWLRSDMRAKAAQIYTMWILLLALPLHAGRHARTAWCIYVVQSTSRRKITDLPSVSHRCKANKGWILHWLRPSACVPAGCWQASRHSGAEGIPLRFEVQEAAGQRESRQGSSFVSDYELRTRSHAAD